MLQEYNYLYNLKNNKKIKQDEDDTIEKLTTNIPSKLVPFMHATCMYQILYGGRSSAKTKTILHKLIKRACEKSNQTILCTREFQSSIATSTYAELKQIIYENDLTHIFKIKYDCILHINGTQFIFKGLARDIMQIKSIPNIDICFVEEAETITRELWEVLDPTLRKIGCELIIAFNPKDKQSATHQKWLIEPIDSVDILRIEINYDENPFNSPLILKKITHMKEHDYARYEHIYLGKVLDISEDVIFKGRFKILSMPVEFKETKFIYNKQTVMPLYGIDFGFSVDPVMMLEIFFLNEKQIYIRREFCKTAVLPNHYKMQIERTFGKYGLNASWSGDSARPDTIAQLRFDGLRIEAAPKGKGSIEAGVEYLLGLEIIIDPSCEHMIYEAYNYKYKIDKNSGSITTDIIDANNHGWDALRYALWKKITAAKRSILNVL